MMILMPILIGLMSLAFAEPPVGDGYSEARSFHNDHHDSDHRGPPSQEYGPPSDTIVSTRSGLSDGYQYNGLNARSSAQRQPSHPPPTVRVSFNQRFGSAATISSTQSRNGSSARSLSQGYTAPNARSGISQEYGPPTTTSLSQKYGVPSVVSARTMSNDRRLPETRSAPSQEYGTPIAEARTNQYHQSPTSNFRSNQLAKATSHDYPASATRSNFQSERQSHKLTASSSRSNNVAFTNDASNLAAASRSAPSSMYAGPLSRSNSNEIPSARSSESQRHLTQTYGAPRQRETSSENYGRPSARALSQEYEVPSGRSNLETEAASSSFGRSSPSSTYLPAARNSLPSDQYGVPEKRDSASLGYDYARARALEELQNQEPANYDFAYQIEDQESGSDFGHTETREENRAQGSYFVVLPDGTKQTVDYEADERGFKPRITLEPAAASGGYDENAGDLTRSADGPY